MSNINTLTNEHNGAVEEAAPPALDTRVDVRSVALALLAGIAVIFTLHWAREVFIPLMLGLMISYALSPIVNWMHRGHIPRALGAAILLISIVGGSGSLIYTLSDDAAQLIESIPDAVKKLRQTVRREQRMPEGTIGKVQRAATELERAANDSSSSSAPAAPNGVVRVQVENPKLDLKNYLWMGTLGAATFVGQASIVLFLSYFILVSGNTFRRKLVTLTGTTLSKKRITLQVLDEINNQIQRYLLVQVFTSILVGIATWLAFVWIGLEHPAIWGVAAGVFNSIPYLGPVVVTGGTAMVALLQFGTLEMAFLVSGVSLAITSLEGYLLTPWLTGRASRMSAVVVFVSVLFWGWLWGVWGLLLGVPIIMMIKSICDRVEDLKPIGELLGE